MKKKLGLVYGGKSAEHEVSLSTARAVTQAVDFDKVRSGSSLYNV